VFKKVSNLQGLGRSFEMNMVTAIDVVLSSNCSDSAEVIKTIALKSKDRSDRRVSVAGLRSVMSNGDVIKALRMAMTDPDSIVQMRVSGQLAQIGDYSGERILLENSRESSLSEKS